MQKVYQTMAGFHQDFSTYMNEIEATLVFLDNTTSPFVTNRYNRGQRKSSPSVLNSTTSVWHYAGTTIAYQDNGQIHRLDSKGHVTIHADSKQQLSAVVKVLGNDLETKISEHTNRHKKVISALNTF